MNKWLRLILQAIGLGTMALAEKDDKKKPEKE